MNGIRYASGYVGLGKTQAKLLRDIPRTFYHRIRTIRNNLSAPGSRTFHDSSITSSVTEEDVNLSRKKTKKYNISFGPDLGVFIQLESKANANCKAKDELLIESAVTTADSIPYVKNVHGGNRKVYFDVYGCQMNVNDTEVVWSILKKNGYKRTDHMETADIVLVVTCAIREGAEEKVWNKLNYLKAIKAKRSTKFYKNPMKIGILGCMAERLKDKILDRNKAVDLIAGPDSYKDLPRLLAITESNETAINVILSFDETYADITPVRLNEDSVSSFVTIMRGCDNMCTYCIVPFTRGRERSRPISSILDEVHHLSDQGVKEVTLLGQNVNSYRDLSKSDFYTGEKTPTNLARGFKTVYKNKMGGVRFSDLLDKVSLINPEMRVRFTSPHPKDFPDEVLHLIAERPNICQQLHLPAQSGNSAVLDRMRRGYTREAYLELVDHVRSIIPNVALSSDFIAGFCGETDEEFLETLTLLELVKYNKTFLFAYSMREKTTAHRRFDDDVDTTVKQKRLQKMIEICRINAEKLNRQQIGTQQLVLVTGKSRRSDETLVGRNDSNTRVVIPHTAIAASSRNDQATAIDPGDYVVVQICNANSNTLSGIPLYHSTISSYTQQMDDHRQQISISR